jgi:glutathione synthase/RimK-type ligase-like ATP-grasp enzyme
MAKLISIGVLVPFQSDPEVAAPEDRPVGRAALHLLREGIEVIFGDQLILGRLSGVIARPGRWEAIADIEIAALHDRYPSQIRSERFSQILAGSRRQGASLPMGNPLSLTLLCRDKIKSQEFLERAGIQMPEVEADPARFATRLEEWGAGFLKPRYGALGTGVRRVVPGDELPERLESVVPERTDPAILQRAVLPADGWAGQAVRVLCQREAHGGWTPNEPVVRQSRKDPVVNAARGAQVRAGSDVLSGNTRLSLRKGCREACMALSAHPTGSTLVEVGLDFVLDPEGHPHLIEVNSRPRGRLEVLARRDPDRFMGAHIQACMRPIRRLAQIARERASD